MTPAPSLCRQFILLNHLLLCFLNRRCRWVRACDVADESSADAADPAAADTGATSSTSSALEKTSRGAQGLSYTAGGAIGVAEQAVTASNDGLTVNGRVCGGSGCASEQSFVQACGARFWSLA